MSANTWPTEQLRPHPLNAEIYGDEPIDPDFRDSIAEDGIITPLVIDQDGTILSGHRRWKVAQALRIAHVPVKVEEVSDPIDAARILIAANDQREKTFTQRMREADEWAGVIAAQAQSRMVEGGRHFGRGMEQDDAAIGAGQTAQPYDERYASRRDRTHRRERYIWRMATGTLPARESAQGVARELVKKLDAGTITAYRAEMELREADQAVEHRAELPREEAPPAPVTVAPDEDAGELVTYPTGDAPEWQAPPTTGAASYEAPPPITSADLLTPVAPVPTLPDRPAIYSVPASPRTEDADDMSVRQYAVLTGYTHLIEDLLKVAHKHRQTLTEIDPREIIPLTTEADDSREASAAIIFDWFARKSAASQRPLRRVK